MESIERGDGTGGDELGMAAVIIPGPMTSDQGPLERDVPRGLDAARKPSDPGALESLVE
jgi:hypothetical protein